MLTKNPALNAIERTALDAIERTALDTENRTGCCLYSLEQTNQSNEGLLYKSNWALGGEFFSSIKLRSRSQPFCSGHRRVRVIVSVGQIQI